MRVCETFEVLLEAGTVVVDDAVPRDEGDGAVGRDLLRAVEGGYLFAIFFDGVVVGVCEGFCGYTTSWLVGNWR